MKTTLHGWPIHLPPPGAAHWQRHATNWLLDVCPAEYRGYQVLGRHPLVLAHLARAHVLAQLSASDRSSATLRDRITGRVETSVVEEALAVVLKERARLRAALHGVDAIGQAFAQK